MFLIDLRSKGTFKNEKKNKNAKKQCFEASIMAVNISKTIFTQINSLSTFFRGSFCFVISCISDVWSCKR